MTTSDLNDDIGTFYVHLIFLPSDMEVSLKKDSMTTRVDIHTPTFLHDETFDLNHLYESLLESKFLFIREF